MICSEVEIAGGDEEVYCRTYFFVQGKGVLLLFVRQFPIHFVLKSFQKV